MQSTWQQLSKEISESVTRAGRAVVAVDGRSGHTSSGILFQPQMGRNPTAASPASIVMSRNDVLEGRDADG